uniref:Uncharacterized protein n=1 Tax=Anguilla anguilla TaxID=7936 RepID=A0A0E9QB95_ANGAN
MSQLSLVCLSRCSSASRLRIVPLLSECILLLPTQCRFACRAPGSPEDCMQ